MNSAAGGLQCRAPVSPYTVLVVVILADCRIDLFENQLSLVQSNINECDSTSAGLSVTEVRTVMLMELCQ